MIETLEQLTDRFLQHTHDGINSQRIKGSASLIGAPVYSVAFAHAVATGTEYFCLSTYAVAEVNAQTPITSSGIISNLYIQVNTPQPATGNAVFVLRINGVDTPVTVTILASSPVGSYSDTTHSVSVVQGDLLSLSATNTNPANPTAAVLQFGFKLS